MKMERLTTILAGLIVIIIGGVFADESLSKKCPDDVDNCFILWGVFIAAISSGIFIAEFLIFRKKPHQTRQTQHQDTSQDEVSLSKWKYTWIRTIGWVTLSGLLASLPFMFREGFFLTFWGLVIGILSVSMVRSALNLLPNEDNNPKN